MDFTITIEGTAPLLMHNARLADPLDPAAKAVKVYSSKRIKTDDDHEQLARLEHRGSLYLDHDIGPYIPGQNIAKALVEAARVTKAGKKVERGLFISSDINPLAYPGPRDIDGLWKDENFRLIATIVVTRQRVRRCRPMFRQWRTQAEGIIDPAVLSLEELAGIADTAGTMIGLGDWRPRYGRFTAIVAEA